MDINSLIQKTITIGPLRLPLVLVSLLLAWIITRRIMKRIYSGNSRLAGFAESIVINSLVTGLLIWKLTPLVFQFRTVIDNPAALLYLPGGLAGIIAGFAGAAVYAVAAINRKKEDRPLFVRAAAINGAIFIGILMLATVAGAVVPDLSAGRAQPAASLDGKPAPDLRLKSIDGIEYSLSDYSGKTVVLNFWASWCPPCRAELPELKLFYQELSGEDIVFLSVNLYSTEQDPNKLPVFIKEEELPFPILLDRSGTAAAAYGVSSIPTTVIINPDGLVKTVKSGAVTASWLKRAVAD